MLLCAQMATLRQLNCCWSSSSKLSDRETREDRRKYLFINRILISFAAFADFQLLCDTENIEFAIKILEVSEEIVEKVIREPNDEKNRK